MPRADDLPPLNITLAELPTAVNQLSVKGAGQAGCMAAPQTIINAILAISDTSGGVRHSVGDRAVSTGAPRWDHTNAHR
jgi:hypothetical protein